MTSNSAATALTRFLVFLGRVKFTMFLLVAGAVIMAVGTIVESRAGREEAWSHVYGTAWFDVFLLLIALNLVLAVVVRIPIQRHQWGFVLTHFAIVLLLVGAWVSRTFGYEGRLFVYEGQEENRIYLDAMEVSATWDGEGATSAAFPVDPAARPSGLTFQDEQGDRPALRLVETVPVGFGETRMDEGSAGDPPGIEVQLSSGAARRADWLIADDARHGRVPVGPLTLACVRGPLGPAGVLGSPGQVTIAVGPAGGLQLCRSGDAGPEVSDLAPGTEVALGTHELSIAVTRVLPHARAATHVIPAPPGDDDGQPFVQLEVSRGGERVFDWLTIGQTASWMLGGHRVEVTFDRQARQIPFSVALTSFEVDYYPGSGRPRQYQSDVVLKSPSLPGGELATVISMNRPLDIDGFRLFQSSYRLGQGGQPDLTILSVSRDPGVPLVYLSFVLVVIGIAWYIARRQPATAVAVGPESATRRSPQVGGAGASRRAGRAASAGAALLAVGLLAGSARAAGVAPAGSLPVDDTRGWAILADGRLKPLQTFANESALAMTGRESLDGLTSLELLWALALAPDDAAQQPWIRVDSQVLKQALALPDSQKRFSFATLAGSAELHRLVDRASAKDSGDEALSRLESDALAVYSTLGRVNELLHGTAVTVVPVARPDGGWSSPPELRDAPAEAERAIAAAWDELAAAYQADDAGAFSAAASRLGQLLPAIAPASYPARAALDRELFHEDFNAYGKAWKLYLLGFLVLLFFGFSETRRWGWWLGVSLLTAGFACHAIGIGLRWAIAQRAPVSNMYESLVFMGGGAIAIGLVPEWIWRKRFFGLAAGLIGFLSLVFAEKLPIDSAINPLVPVLAHTYWLSVHVMTIMLSYSAMALAMVLGHGVLWVLLFQPARAERLQALSQALYKTLQVGLLFLAAGIACGAIWANESWGRYWGWDPKETWSLITFFVYLVIVHAKFAGWVRDFGIAALSILGFMSVVMTYYGVNFVLAAGLHSYGTGQGGPGWAMAYAAVESAIVAAAWMKYRSIGPRLAPG